jgi:hypothetical protein
VTTERTVLFVAHNGATLDRLLDVAEVFASDLRVRIVVTSDLSDPFAGDLPELVAGAGLAAVPWSDAVARRYDLIVAASYHGPLDELTGPLLALSHGAGYGKYAPGSRTVFGPELLPVGTAAVARPESHGVPAALIGDPCFDDLAAMTGDPSDTVVITSTWGAGSLFGTGRDVIRAAVEAGYDTRLILHPNVWAWYGEHQIRLWLRGSLRDGLILVPPLRAWRRELARAGHVIGDHGSVTVYAAALGRPTLLGAFPDDQVVPGSPAHRLGQVASRYDPGVPLDVQLGEATGHPELTGLVTAVPGEARSRLRATCYRLLDLEEPAC